MNKTPTIKQQLDGWKEYATKKHGGKRKGSGRPKKEKTVVMRIPKSKVKEVKNIIK